MLTPSSVNSASVLTRAPPLSAAAPINGASTAIAKLAMPLPMPSRNVLTVGSVPALQYCLKKTGKKPAMTVVANDELAQSYMAQAKTGRRSNADLPDGDFPGADLRAADLPVVESTGAGSNAADMGRVTSPFRVLRWGQL